MRDFSLSLSLSLILLGNPTFSQVEAPSNPSPPQGPSSTWSTGGNSSLTSSYWLGTWDNAPLIIKTNNIERFRVKPNGFVGIGTINPGFLFTVAGTEGATKLVLGGTQYTGALLSITGNFNLSGGAFMLNTTNAFGYDMAINGDAIFERVVVKAYSDWPDFVFSSSYNLLSLGELKRYITRNGHLPNVPDAATVTEEGMDVYEMNKLLLLKVEELTLYLIKLEDRIRKLEE